MAEEEFLFIYLFKITSKHVADDYVTDSHGHTIAKGEPYFVGCIFEKTAKEMKNHSYQQSKGFADVFLHHNKVFATNVDFNVKVLDKCDYLLLCAEIY